MLDVTAGAQTDVWVGCGMRGAEELLVLASSLQELMSLEAF